MRTHSDLGRAAGGPGEHGADRGDRGDRGGADGLVPGDLAPGDLAPHRPPWPVLDRIVAIDGERVVAEKRVSADDPLWPPGGTGGVGGVALGGLVLLELAAQAAACLVGSANRGRTGHLGYLVAARGWKFPRPGGVRPGETVRVTVARRATMGALASFRATVTVGDEEVAAGELTCAARFDA